jgi:CRISPR system Cascade subunit CasA
MPPASFTFDLLVEPWIPCERLDGTRGELGIRETFSRAHELAAISDESPLVTAVLYRLLLAILDRALQPKDRDDWVAVWRAERLPMEPIAAYLGKWKHRFDLFDAERPFMQLRGLDALLSQERGEPPTRMPARTLAVEHSQYGSDVHLFEASRTDSFLTPAQAARGVLVFQGYAAGGKIKNETSSWTEAVLRSGAAVIARAAKLSKTLLLNVVPRESRGTMDVPPWERGRNIGRIVRSVVGPIDQLTWPSRRVEMLPVATEGRVVVFDAITAAGERSDAKVEDPQFCYLVGDKESPPFPVKFRTAKATWRDSTALFDGTKSSNVHRRPAALDQLAALVHDRIIERHARFDCELLGLSGKPANTMVYFWARERWPLPPSVLVDSDRVAALREALTLAEDVGLALDRKVLFALCGRALSVGDRKADPKDVKNVRDSLGVMPGYWSDLGNNFEAWLASLGDADDADDALPHWRDRVRAAADRAFKCAVSKLGTSARALQAIALAESAYRRMLRETLGARKQGPDARIETQTETVPT